MRFSVRTLLLAVAVLASLGGLARYTYSRQYPYGWSNCCDKGLQSALLNYANDHGGSFPAGEATPEASLSLLYPKYIDAYTLSGKSVPLAQVEAALARNGRLSPDTCGWHYVEGLRSNDNPELALFWDKAGLGHNGERLAGGGHVVCRLDYGHDYISASQWPAFVARQQELLAARNQQPGPLIDPDQRTTEQTEGD